MNTILRKTSGLWVISRFAPEKGVTHRAILDSTNQLGHLGFAAGTPIRYELLPAGGLQAQRHDFGLEWNGERFIADQLGAIQRLDLACESWPRAYDLSNNNCEHFVSFVEHGIRRSPQIDAVVWIGIGALALIAFAPGPRRAA